MVGKIVSILQHLITYKKILVLLSLELFSIEIFSVPPLRLLVIEKQLANESKVSLFTPRSLHIM